MDLAYASVCLGERIWSEMIFVENVWLKSGEMRMYHGKWIWEKNCIQICFVPNHH